MDHWLLEPFGAWSNHAALCKCLQPRVYDTRKETEVWAGGGPHGGWAQESFRLDHVSPFTFTFLWGGHSDVSDVLRVLGLWGGRGASPFAVLGSLPFKSEATKSTSISRRLCSRLRGELLCWRPTAYQAPACETLGFQREYVEQPTLDSTRLVQTARCDTHGKSESETGGTVDFAGWHEKNKSVGPTT